MCIWGCLSEEYELYLVVGYFRHMVWVREGGCMRMVRVRPRWVVGRLALRCGCRALLVLGVRVHYSFGNALAFVPFSSRPRSLYVVGICLVTSGEGRLPFICWDSNCIYVYVIG